MVRRNEEEEHKPFKETMKEIEGRVKDLYPKDTLQVEYHGPDNYFGPGEPPDPAFWLVKRRAFGLLNKPIMALRPGFRGAFYGRKVISAEIRDPKIQGEALQVLQEFAEESGATEIDVNENFKKN